MFSRRQFVPVALAYSTGFACAAGARGTVVWSDAAEFVDSIGLNTHFGQEQTPYVRSFDAVAERIDEIGVRNLREDLGAGVRVGAVAPQFERLNRMARKGYRFSLVCFDGGRSGVYVPPEATPMIQAWCQGAVDYFEGPNEPVIGRGAEAGMKLLDYQSRLYEAVRSAPDLRRVGVVGPSLTPSQAVFARPMARVVDFGNIHPYPGHFNPETKRNPASLGKYVQVSEPLFAGKKMFATETGYHSALKTKRTHLPVPEGLRARYLPRLLLWYSARGIQRTYIYEAVSSFARGDTDPESHFGLLQNDLTPTPVYHAVKNLVSLFSASESKRRETQLSVRLQQGGEDLQVLGFRRNDGARLVALWRSGEGGDAHTGKALEQPSLPVTLHIDGRPKDILFHRFEDSGRLSTSRISPSDGILKLQVDDRLAVAVLS